MLKQHLTKSKLYCSKKDQIVFKNLNLKSNLDFYTLFVSNQTIQYDDSY